MPVRVRQWDPGEEVINAHIGSHWYRRHLETGVGVKIGLGKKPKDPSSGPRMHTKSLIQQDTPVIPILSQQDGWQRQGNFLEACRPASLQHAACKQETPATWMKKTGLSSFPTHALECVCVYTNIHTDIRGKKVQVKISKLPWYPKLPWCSKLPWYPSLRDDLFL